LTEVRKKGCRILMVDGKPWTISAKWISTNRRSRDMDAVVDRFVVAEA